MTTLIQTSKKNWRALLPLVALVMASSQALPARADEYALTATDYGTLYLLEEREPVKPSWTAGFDYARQLNNPYLDVQGLSLSGAREFGHYFSAGLVLTRYFASENSTTQTVGATLGAQGVYQNVARPEWSGFATVSVAPLSGRLNLFSYATLPFDLQLTAGIGGAHDGAASTRFAALWLMSPRAMVSRRVGVNLSVGQLIEAPGSDNSLANFEGRLGTFLRF